MAGTSTESTWRPPDWFIKLCRFPWRARGFIVGNIVVNLVLGVLVTWLFIGENDIKGKHIEWVFQYRWWFFAIVLAWGLITFVISPLFHLVPLKEADTKPKWL